MWIWMEMEMDGDGDGDGGRGDGVGGGDVGDRPYDDKFILHSQILARVGMPSRQYIVRRCDWIEPY